jgi:predicted O-methyltransferase YrrM
MEEEPVDHREQDSVDRYFEQALLSPDAAFEQALIASERAGLRAINVSPLQGKLLQLLAQSIGARTILEVGTLGGYSTIWLARALTEAGRLVTLEIDPIAAVVARANLDRAGLASQVEVRLGAARDSLAELVAEGFGPVDFAFIDADKENNLAYFQAALQLSRPGSLIVIDNVVRGGRVVDAQSNDPSVTGTRALVDALSNDPRVSTTAIQTFGSKGWDGFILARVNS